MLLCFWFVESLCFLCFLCFLLGCVFVLFVLLLGCVFVLVSVKSFRKNNKKVWNCPDELIYITTTDDFHSLVPSSVLNKPQENVTNIAFLLKLQIISLINVGIWEDKEDIPSYSSDEVELFQPDGNLREKYLSLFTQWQNAVKRCLKWYWRIFGIT